MISPAQPLFNKNNPKQTDPHYSEKRFLVISERKKNRRNTHSFISHSIVYATGQTRKAQVVTGDEHFKKLRNVLFIK